MNTQSILLITLIYLIGVALSMFVFYMHNRINKHKARIYKLSLFEASILSIFSFFMVIVFLSVQIIHKVYKYTQKNKNFDLLYKKLNKKFISEED